MKKEDSRGGTEALEMRNVMCFVDYLLVCFL